MGASVDDTEACNDRVIDRCSRPQSEGGESPAAFEPVIAPWRRGSRGGPRLVRRQAIIEVIGAIQLC
jgi:hypothetical protein